MTHVATLISNPAAPGLTDAIVTRTAKSLPQAQAPVWLAPDVAADIPFTPAAGQDVQTLLDALKLDLQGLAVDIAVQGTAHRRKKLLVADMDSTMIGQECIDELAGVLGLKEKVAEITERAMNGEIAFEPALRERVALLRGLPKSVVDDVLADRITLMPGARTLVRTMKANGAYAALVSGGFTVFTGPVSKMIGFDEHRSNILLVEGDTLAGEVQEPILGKEAKLASLKELTAAHDLSIEDTMAVGDGANDLAMLQAAGLGVAYHAKPAVAAAAHLCVDHGDLTALLYIQGYRQSDFAA
ncbi:phosphoserine phosphatase SerB [Agaricicola taiwanensis]|uniref:Phosphoserine phosphatase n=1 Tax=Agaricicola taiwanensis TaxID=591372 RepID=A0A8J2YHB9_9RHOB|nr:phosphoserine phosphatase SerB [Agaricicola taiwanensis]GGE42603.1 phosphoserine phosphatase SerB [Agaricicola taiwanensis]